MRESEIQHHIRNRQIAEGLNDDHSGSFGRVATSIDAQALPHNKQDKVGLPNVVALGAAFELIASGQRRSILIGQ
jgi:hypothetical protein